MSLGISTDNHIKDNQKFLSDNYKKSIIFAMLSKDMLNPYSYMLEVLSSERYERIVA